MSIGGLLKVINSNTILGWLDDLHDGVINVIMAVIGPFLWGLCDIFFVILDLFELIFKKFAGIGTGVTDSTGAEIEGDLVLFLIQSDLVQQIFMSILILSLFLLIVFTIFAIVKNQYSDKQEPVSKIINSSFKALFMYLLVPVATIVCLIVGNIILQAIDSATKPTAESKASGLLFVSAAYNANELREDNNLDDAREVLVEWIEDGRLTKISAQMASIGITDASSAAMATQEQINQIANLVDNAFANGTPLSDSFNSGYGVWGYYNVYRYYSVADLSFLIIWVGGAFLIWAIGKITWGMVARLFKMTLYFAISPAVMATFPIDNGKALGSWRGEMVKNGTMAYCAIGVLNVLYSVLPFFNNINLFGVGAISDISNSIVRLFIYIIAFSSAKDLIGAISGWFGTGDALAEGIKAKSAVTSQLDKRTKQAIGMFGGIKGGWKEAKDHGGNRLMGALQGGLSATGIPGKFKPYSDEYQKAGKAGAEQYKSHRTMAFTGDKQKEKLAAYEAYDIIDKENKRLQPQLDYEEKQRTKKLLDAESRYAEEKITLEELKDERKEIEDAYRKAVEKIKSSASYIDALFTDTQRELESQQKKNEKRQSNFSSMDSLEKSYEQDSMIRKRVLASSGFDESTLAYKTLESQWTDIKQGNFDVIKDTVTRKKIESAYGMFASDITSNDHDMQRAKQSMANLVNSGADGLKYVQKVLGDKFTHMFTEVKNAAGEVEYQLKDTRYSDADISAKIRKEQDGINKALNEWEAKNKKLVEERAAKFGTDLKEDLEKIGKNAGK